MILFTPQGYVSVPEAAKQLFLRQYPDERLNLRLCGQDLRTLEGKSLDRAARAIVILFEALADGALIAVDKQRGKVPTFYWEHNTRLPEQGQPHREYLMTGLIEGQPVFIEEGAFDKWLNASYPPVSEPTMDNKASLANTNTVSRPTRKSTRKEPPYFPALRKFIAQQCRDSSFAGLAMKTKAERFKKWLTNNDARVFSQLPSTRQQLEASIKKCEAEAPQASRK
jgi:hypothetical protein